MSFMLDKVEIDRLIKKSQEKAVGTGNKNPSKMKMIEGGANVVLQKAKSDFATYSDLKKSVDTSKWTVAQKGTETDDSKAKRSASATKLAQIRSDIKKSGICGSNQSVKIITKTTGKLVAGSAYCVTTPARSPRASCSAPVLKRIRDENLLKGRITSSVDKNGVMKEKTQVGAIHCIAKWVRPPKRSPLYGKTTEGKLMSTSDLGVTVDGLKRLATASALKVTEQRKNKNGKVLISSKTNLPFKTLAERGYQIDTTYNPIDDTSSPVRGRIKVFKEVAFTEVQFKAWQAIKDNPMMKFKNSVGNKVASNRFLELTKVKFAEDKTYFTKEEELDIKRVALKDAFTAGGVINLLKPNSKILSQPVSNISAKYLAPRQVDIPTEEKLYVENAPVREARQVNRIDLQSKNLSKSSKIALIEKLTKSLPQ